MAFYVSTRFHSLGAVRATSPHRKTAKLRKYGARRLCLVTGLLIPTVDVIRIADSTENTEANRGAPWVALWTRHRRGKGQCRALMLPASIPYFLIL